MTVEIVEGATLRMLLYTRDESQARGKRRPGTNMYLYEIVEFTPRRVKSGAFDAETRTHMETFLWHVAMGLNPTLYNVTSDGKWSETNIFNVPK